MTSEQATARNVQQLLDAEIETLRRRAETAEALLQVTVQDFNELKKTAAFFRETLERLVNCDEKATWWIQREVARRALSGPRGQALADPKQGVREL